MADHRENDGLGDLGAESPGGLSDEQVESDTPLSSVTASTHDTSRSRYRMKELGTFAKRLEEAASRAFPVQGRARYKQVIAVLIQWGDDDLNVQPEIDRLRTIFEACYGFFTQRWKIPSASSHLKLMSMVLHFVEDYGSPDNLMIIYYCGHAEINDGCATWLCKQDPSSPFVNWTAIQTLFEETSSDVLFLLDSCATSGLATGGGQGIIETIAACGAEEWSPGPGRHLFTHALISVLEDWITRPSFSAAMLHSELLAAIKHEKPERRKWKDLQRMQDRRTPVYIFSASDPKVLSIELATRRTVNGRSSANFSRPAIPSSPPPPSTVFSQFDIYNPSNLIKTLKNGDLQIPHVLISVALDEDSAPDVEAWYRWIRQIPALAKYGVVEGVYKSHSTMLLISIPLLIWDMLPDDLAISFVAYVQSRNLLAAESVEDFQRLAGTKEATSSNTLETDASQTAASIEHHINYLKRLVQNPEPAPTPEPELGSATLIKIKTLPDPPLSERIQRAKTTEPHRRSAKVDGARFAAEMAKDLELHRRSAKIPSYFNALSETKINDILTEAKFAREEATRAWEELGRREKEERERVQLLKEGKPVFIGRTQVIATDSQSATPEKNSKAEAILGTLLGLSPRDAVKKHVRARSEPRNPTKSRNINGIPGRGMSFIDHKTKMLYGPLPLPKRKPVPVSVTQQNISKTDKEKKAEKERERQRDMVIKLEKERNKEREKKRPDPEVLRQIMSFQSRSLERFSTVTASTRTKEGSPLASPHVGTIPSKNIPGNKKEKGEIETAYTFLHDEDGVVDSGAATAAAVVDEGRGLLKELDAWGEKLENTVTRRPLPLPPVVLMPNSNVPERKGSKLIKKGKEGRGGQEGKREGGMGCWDGREGKGKDKEKDRFGIGRSISVDVGVGSLGSGGASAGGSPHGLPALRW